MAQGVIFRALREMRLPRRTQRFLLGRLAVLVFAVAVGGFVSGPLPDFALLLSTGAEGSL